jgi:hypothetical protein
MKFLRNQFSLQQKLVACLNDRHRLVHTGRQFFTLALVQDPRTAGKGKRTARWAADGNGIEVNENSTFDSSEGSVNVQMIRTWMLSADAKTLKIDIAVEGPNGKQQVKRTFTRK